MALIGSEVSDKMFEHCGQRRRQKRTTVQGYTISLPCEPYGTGELKLNNKHLGRFVSLYFNVEPNVLSNNFFFMLKMKPDIKIDLPGNRIKCE